MKRNSRLSIWLVLALFFGFSALQQAAWSQDGQVKLPSKNVVELTHEQFSDLLNQPGISYSPHAAPAAVPKGNIIFEIPQEFGSGYIWGTPEAIASGLNAVGATVGATAGFVQGLGVYAVSTIIGGATAVAGAIAAALGGEGAEGTTQHPTTSHH